MNKSILAGLVILIISAFVSSEELPSIKLKAGDNEIRVKINNKSGLDLKSICIETNQENLPEGLSVTTDAQCLEVPANSQSKTSLKLNLHVSEEIDEGIYKIPIVIKDKANRTWNVTLTEDYEIEKADKYELHQNYPNPFNTHTQIRYKSAAEQEAETKLIIYDALGRRICTLVDIKQPHGTYQVSWDGKDERGAEVSSGIYFYKLTADSFVKMNKMMFLK